MLRLFLFMLLGLAALPAHAKGEVAWTVRLEPADVRAGEHAQIVAEAKVAPEWHVYSTVKVPNGPRETKFELLEGSKLKQTGGPTFPEPHTEFDKGFKVNVQYYENAVAFGVPVQVDPGASGKQTATLKIGYMVCKHGTCLPPDRLELPVDFTVAAGPAREDRKQALTAAPTQPAGYTPPAAGASTDGPAPAPDDVDGFRKQIQDTKAQGLLAFLGLAVLMGFAALLTPCVFPMVPITVSYFSKQQEAGKSGVKGAFAYCLGIILTYTGVGVLMAVLFGATSIGRFAANPIVNIALALLFIVLALNLFGVFEIQLPSWLVERGQEGSRKGGFVGPLLMGLTFTLTSFTCTVGFVGGLLATTTQGDVLWPVIGMLAFSTAFASPFFLLALFPGWLAKMPKSGSWMVTVKAFMGFLELAAALKFLSNVDLQYRLGILTQPVFLAIWSTLFLVAGAYLFGWLKLPHSDNDRPGVFRIGFGIASAVLGVWCLAAINGASLGKFSAFPPPREYPGRSTGHSATGVTWLEAYDKAVAQAKAENKPLFIDFTGITCTNCREMEETVFNRGEVAGEFKKFVTVRLFTDLENDAESERYKKMQQDRFGTVELPLYVVLNPDESKIGQISYEPNAGKFVDFLKSSQAKFAESTGAQVARGD